MSGYFVFSFWVLLCFAACKQASPDASKHLATLDHKANEKDLTIKSPVLDTTQLRFNKDYLMGQFNPADHVDFVLIDSKHADRTGLYLRKDTYEAFKKLYAAALEENVHLIIRSATRNFNSQKNIWERKWDGKTKLEGNSFANQIADPVERARKILLYSSMPGTSRHHWGTDIDLNAFTNTYFESGAGYKIYQWLLTNAASYGFCQPYTKKGVNRPSGYEEEKWHWSYLPISVALTQQAAQTLTDDQIKGFKGAEVAKTIKVVQNYVLGIEPRCRNPKN